MNRVSNSTSISHADSKRLDEIRKEKDNIRNEMKEKLGLNDYIKSQVFKEIIEDILIELGVHICSHDDCD